MAHFDSNLLKKILLMATIFLVWRAPHAGAQNNMMNENNGALIQNDGQPFVPPPLELPSQMTEASPPEPAPMPPPEMVQLPSRGEEPPAGTVGFSSASNAGSGGTPFQSAKYKPLKLMTRVPGPTCTFDEWKSGKWFHGKHDKNFGWWWIVKDTYYNFEKRQVPMPDYERRTIITYKETKAPDKGPQPASIKSSSLQPASR